MNSLCLSDSYLLMWGISYLACAIVKPDIIGNITPELSMFLLIAAGILYLAGLALRKRLTGKIILTILGIVETFGGVLSWSGQIVWNVPFSEKAIFNVSMASLDLVSAVVLFFRALGGKVNG